jgi:predicted AAA+ superfamily ATPase
MGAWPNDLDDPHKPSGAQRRTDVFPVLRLLADRRPRPARVLVLGRASLLLVREASEAGASRFAFVALEGFDPGETRTDTLDRLWP